MPPCTIEDSRTRGLDISIATRSTFSRSFRLLLTFSTSPTFPRCLHWTDSALQIESSPCVTRMSTPSRSLDPAILVKIYAYHSILAGQATLCSACYVSRQWGAAAQSALYRIAWVRSRDRMKQFIEILRSDSKLRGLVKEMRLQGGKSEGVIVEDWEHELKDVFSVVEVVNFVSFQNMVGVLGCGLEGLQSMDTDQTYGSVMRRNGQVENLLLANENELKEEWYRPAVQRATIRTATLTNSDEMMQFRSTIQLWSKLKSLRLIDPILNSTSPSLLQSSLPRFNSLQHIVYHGEQYAPLVHLIAPALSSLISLTLQFVDLDHPITEATPSLFDALQNSPSLVTVKLLRIARSTPPSLVEAETACRLIVAHLQNCKTLKKVCFDYSYYGGKSVLDEQCYKLGIRVVWGIFVTDEEEWNRPAWGARLPF